MGRVEGKIPLACTWSVGECLSMRRELEVCKGYIVWCSLPYIIR